MPDALDVTTRPGLAYQHAFDWLAVRLSAAVGPAAYAVAAGWQLREMAGRLPGIPALAGDAAGRDAVAAALGWPEIRDDAGGPLQAVALVEPPALPRPALDRLQPGGRLYVVSGGRAARFLAERRGSNRPVLSEKEVAALARAEGLRVVERLGLHPPAAVLAHYAGEAALAFGRRDWRDRRHHAMRRDFVTTGPTTGWSALVCLALERGA